MIAIKDMEMPKCCWNCDFCCAKDDYYKVDYYCAISKNELAMEVADIPDENRPSDCPLVEIITCKDCKYYREDEDTGYCTNHTCRDIKFWCRDDYYCADAERRE